jgi:hypothetical protein
LHSADFVEKVDHGFHGRKVSDRDRSIYFWRRFPGADFTQQRAKMAFSLVNGQVVLDDRLFQQNRPRDAVHERPVPTEAV